MVPPPAVRAAVRASKLARVAAAAEPPTVKPVALEANDAGTKRRYSGVGNTFAAAAVRVDARGQKRAREAGTAEKERDEAIAVSIMRKREGCLS